MDIEGIEPTRVYYIHTAVSLTSYMSILESQTISQIPATSYRASAKHRIIVGFSVLFHHQGFWCFPHVSCVEFSYQQATTVDLVATFSPKYLG